ncbi:phage terminase large subunit [Halobacillus ihumii]|uniref:phage terminase large subunit n=1 Tax=Halobacillus ihumii TaxID=2686092 RepID=UPI001966FE2F|nr:phage terminase large subunit [Halobacillus ihumii]
MNENVGIVDRKYIVDQTARKKRMKLIAEAIELLSRLRKENGNLNERQTNQLIDYMEELKALNRIDKSDGDTLYFAYEYFSEERNPENGGNLIPEGIEIDDAPEFHTELTGIMNVVSNEEINKRVAWSAPRGHAKSAYLSNIFPVHQIAFGKRHYLLIISETDAAAKKFVEWIGDEMKHNEKLRNDFGELLSPEKSRNEKDNEHGFLTTTGTMVEAASIGKQLRGKRNGAHRPDLVICDDLESSKNTNTPELIEKNIHWFNSVVIPIGEPDRTAFIYMGTAVTAEGLLQHVMGRSDFHSKKFAAIVEEPDRGDLWDEYESILRDQENENRKEEAEEFFERNKEEMEKGHEVLWSGRWNYKALIHEKVNMGSRAFNSEFMNNPIDTENAIFRPDELTYFDYEEKHEKERFFEYFTAWDIAMGKNKNSDYNAIVTVARDKRTGVYYIVEAWAKKVPAHQALNKALEVMKKYNPKVFMIETVAAQHDFYRQLKAAMPKEGIYRTKLLPVQSRTKKEERIEALEPLVENGALRFMRHQRLLLEQLEQFPNGVNDDLPDALQMAIEAGTKMRRLTHYKKPKGI